VLAIFLSSSASAYRCINLFCIAVTSSVAAIAVRRDLTAGSNTVLGLVWSVRVDVFIVRFFVMCDLCIVYSCCV